MGPPKLVLLVCVISLASEALSIDQSLMESVFSKVNDELRWMEDVKQEYIPGHPRIATAKELYSLLTN